MSGDFSFLDPPDRKSEPAKEIEIQRSEIVQPHVSNTPDWTQPASGVSGQCKFHEQAAALKRCFQCSAALCQVCSFDFPGGVNLCPDCVAAPKTSLSSMRKQFVAWGLVMALLATIAMVGMMSGFFASDQSGILVMICLMGPAMLGMGLAWSAYEKRAANPPIVWVGIVWTIVINLIWLALCVVGMMMQANAW
jgi:hypothetical protein